MDGRGGAFFADEIDDDTVLGSDDGIFAWTATYVGVFGCLRCPLLVLRR